MSKFIEIPGGIAVLRSPETIRERHRRLILAASDGIGSIYARLPQELRQASDGDGPEADAAKEACGRMLPLLAKTLRERMAIREWVDALIIALLESWSRPGPLPDIDTLQDVEPEVYDALAEAITPFVKEVMTKAMPVNFEIKPLEEGGPFGNSPTSDTSSKVAAEPRSTKRRPSVSGDSATGNSTQA